MTPGRHIHIFPSLCYIIYSLLSANAQMRLEFTPTEDEKAPTCLQSMMEQTQESSTAQLSEGAYLEMSALVLVSVDIPGNSHTLKLLLNCLNSLPVTVFNMPVAAEN